MNVYGLDVLSVGVEGYEAHGVFCRIGYDGWHPVGKDDLLIEVGYRLPELGDNAEQEPSDIVSAFDGSEWGTVQR